MKISETQVEGNEELKFPLTVPHRIIALRDRLEEDELRGALKPFTLTEELTPSHASQSGKYVSFSFTALLANRNEFYQLDARLREVPGVRMVL